MEIIKGLEAQEAGVIWFLSHSPFSLGIYPLDIYHQQARGHPYRGTLRVP